MTRSTAKRMNANARKSVTAVDPRSAVAWRSRHGAFTPDTAARAIRATANLYVGIDDERLDECNWPYAAELLNRMTR